MSVLISTEVPSLGLQGEQRDYLNFPTAYNNSTEAFHSLLTQISRFRIWVSVNSATPRRFVGDSKLLFHSLHKRWGTQSGRNHLGFGQRPGWDRDVRMWDAEQSRDLLVSAVLGSETPGSIACGFGKLIVEIFRTAKRHICCYRLTWEV